MDRAILAKKRQRDVKTVRDKNIHVQRQRQKDGRQANMMARRPELLQTDNSEKTEELSLTPREKRRAVSRTVFMQNYENFKKNKQKRQDEEKMSKKMPFKVHVVKQVESASFSRIPARPLASHGQVRALSMKSTGSEKQVAGSAIGVKLCPQSRPPSRPDKNPKTSRLAPVSRLGATVPSVSTRGASATERGRGASVTGRGRGASSGRGVPTASTVSGRGALAVSTSRGGAKLSAAPPDRNVSMSTRSQSQQEVDVHECNIEQVSSKDAQAVVIDIVQSDTDVPHNDCDEVDKSGKPAEHAASSRKKVDAFLASVKGCKGTKLANRSATDRSRIESSAASRSDANLSVASNLDSSKTKNVHVYSEDLLVKSEDEISVNFPKPPVLVHDSQSERIIEPPSQMGVDKTSDGTNSQTSDERSVESCSMKYLEPSDDPCIEEEMMDVKETSPILSRDKDFTTRENSKDAAFEDKNDQTYLELSNVVALKKGSSLNSELISDGNVESGPLNRSVFEVPIDDISRVLSVVDSPSPVVDESVPCDREEKSQAVESKDINPRTSMAKPSNEAIVADVVKNEEVEVSPEYVDKANEFIKTMDDQIDHFTSLSTRAEKFLEDPAVSEELKGQIRAVTGKAKLLITKKFKQFRGLCDNCIHPPEGEPRTAPSDLQGFWEMVGIQIEEVDEGFAKLFRLEANGWVVEEPAVIPVASKRPLAAVKNQLPKKNAAPVDASKPKKPRMNFRAFLAKKKMNQMMKAKESPAKASPSRVLAAQDVVPSTPPKRAQPSSSPSQPSASVNESPSHALVEPVVTLLTFTPTKPTSSVDPNSPFAHPPVLKEDAFLFGGNTPEMRRIRRSSIFSANHLRKLEQGQPPMIQPTFDEEEENAIENDLISF